VSQKSPGFRAIACYDGTEISTVSAFELLKAFSSEEQETLLRRARQPETITARDGLAVSQ